MKHIQSCAKKHSLTDDTLRILLRKEVDASPSPPPGKAKGKQKSVSSEPVKVAATLTLLEDVVEAVETKRGRRPKPLDTVKSVTETRDNILVRARQLIDTTSSFKAPTTGSIFSARRDVTDVTSSGIPATQVFGDSALARVPSSSSVRLDTDDGLPLTQKFAPSKFGPAETSALFYRTSSLTDSYTSATQQRLPVAPDVPAMAPVFAPSKLSTAFEPATVSIVYSAISDMTDDTQALLDYSSANDVFLPQTATPSSSHASEYVNERHGDASKEIAFTPHVHRNDEDFNHDFDCNDGWDQEKGMYNDVCFDIEPEKTLPGPYGSPDGEEVRKVASESTAKSRRNLPLSPQGSLTSSPVRQDIVESTATKPRSGKSGTQPKIARTNKQEMSEEEFNAKLHDAVLKDRVLHIRVLRYEVR